jgi:transcription termination/antitermination protein NusA
VGMKGMRVQSIIRELRGEKIDIIEFNEDTVTFAANALSPAKINHVSIVDTEQKHLEVIVDDTQLSLAIGKKGQNVRLAAKLLGWRIDIKSEEEKRQEIESQMAAMALRGAAISELKGLGEKTLSRLLDHGVETVEQLAQMTPDELTQISGIGEKTVERIRKVVTDYFERDAESAEEAAPVEEAASEAPAETEAPPAEASPEQPGTMEESAAAETTEENAAAETKEESAAEETSSEPESPAELATESGAEAGPENTAEPVAEGQAEKQEVEEEKSE